MVSLIITVKNERHSLPAWLQSINRQTVHPDEIIIVDGGSTDGTWEWLQSKADLVVHVFQHPGTIALGRNVAINESKGDIIAVTDAGCTYDATWLEKLVKPITNGKDFSATAFKPWLEDGLKLVSFLLAAATTPAAAEFQKPWLPSSRSVAFKKFVWEKVGGYPEWIPYCEDVLFDIRLAKIGVKPELVRETLVSWLPRPTIKSYFRQLFNYTRSDGHGKLWYGRQLTRYAVYSCLAVVLFLAATKSLAWFVPIVLGGSLYMIKFWRRFLEFASGPTTKRFLGLLLLPGIIFIGDIAKMMGWPVGVLQRWTGKIQFRNWK